MIVTSAQHRERLVEASATRLILGNNPYSVSDGQLTLGETSPAPSQDAISHSLWCDIHCPAISLEAPLRACSSSPWLVSRGPHCNVNEVGSDSLVTWLANPSLTHLIMLVLYHRAETCDVIVGTWEEHRTGRRARSGGVN